MSDTSQTDRPAGGTGGWSRRRSVRYAADRPADVNGAEVNGAEVNGAEVNAVEVNGAEMNGAEANGTTVDGADMNRANRTEPDRAAGHRRAAPVEPTSGGANRSTRTTYPPPWDIVRDLVVPLAIFAVTRLVQVLILDWMLRPGQTLSDRLLSWDADWFIQVATTGYPHGYTYDSGGNLTGNGLAFFPFYPWLIRGVDSLGVPPADSALVVSWTAAAVAAVLVYALGRRLATAAGRPAVVARRIGYALLVLCFAQPLSIVLSMGYSEPVFLALVAGMFLAAYRRWWLLAGLLGFAAGLTRPTGAAAAIGLAVAAGMCVANRARRGPEKAAAVIGAMIALAGVPAYIGWVGLRVGHLDAWFKIQTAGWGTTFDFGHSTWTFVSTSVRTSEDFVALSVVVILIAATVALVLGVRQNASLPLTVYGVLAYVLVIGQAGYFHSKPRLLLPVLLILLPAAFAAGRARPSRAALWLVAYAAVGLWYGAYMITVWQYAI